MVYELRTYTVMPGRMPDLHSRFKKITLGFFRKHGIKVIGFWTYVFGGSSDELVYMLAYKNLADCERKWAAFMADPERIAEFVKTEKDGPLVSRIVSKILLPTAYSPPPT